MSLVREYWCLASKSHIIRILHKLHHTLKTAWCPQQRWKAKMSTTQTSSGTFDNAPSTRHLRMADWMEALSDKRLRYFIHDSQVLNFSCTSTIGTNVKAKIILCCIFVYCKIYSWQNTATAKFWYIKLWYIELPVISNSSAHSQSMQTHTKYELLFNRCMKVTGPFWRIQLA